MSIIKITEQSSSKKRKSKSLQELSCYGGTNKGTFKNLESSGKKCSIGNSNFFFL